MRRRLVWLGLVLAVVASACGGDDGGEAEPASESGFDVVVELEVLDEELVGGSRQVDIDAGDNVQVVLSGDTEDQVHVHGYDLYIDPVDGEGELVFDAIIPGTFEIELEGSGRLLIRMTVS